MSIGENHSALCNLVHEGSFDSGFRIEAGKITVTQIIGENNYNIWPIGLIISLGSC
jgi:hypothetical protein